MIRTTYRGRELKILKARKPGHVRQSVGGQVTNHEWSGTEQEALDNLKLIIDCLDEKEPRNAIYEAPHWWPPATNTGSA